MSRLTVSRWRTESRRVIREVLAAQPAGTPVLRLKALLSERYPFGERKYHPYRIFLDEVREALRPFQEDPEPSESKIGYRLSNRGGKRPWLDVVCDWCHGKVKGGCLVCLRLHVALQGLVTRDEWKVWMAAIASGDELAPLVLADRLDELGHEEAAIVFREWGRKQMEPPTKKRRKKT